jgi:hypothetical protein
MESLQFLTDDMIKCHRLSYTLKCITGTEVLFATFFALLTNYWLCVPLVISLLGYLGAKTYNGSMIFSYGVYIGSGLMGKWVLLVYNWYEISDKRIYIATIALSMDTIISIWGIFIVTKLYIILRRVPVLNLSTLNSHANASETYLVLGTEK